MELEQPYRLFLLDLLDGYVFKDLINDNGDYWERCFERRNKHEDDGADWTEIAPFTDIFKMVIVKKPSKDNEFPGEFCHCSIVPLSIWHWDAILSYYLLSNPTLYQSPSHLAGLLLKTFYDLKLHPAGVTNFPAEIWFWLKKVQDGEASFKTIEAPINACYALKWIQYMVHKYGDDAVWKDGFDSTNENAIKDDVEIRADVEKKFNEVVSRHPHFQIVKPAADGTPDSKLEEQ